jgi:hypothetical protein
MKCEESKILTQFVILAILVDDPDADLAAMLGALTRKKKICVHVT